MIDLTNPKWTPEEIREVLEGRAQGPFEAGGKTSGGDVSGREILHEASLQLSQARMNLLRSWASANGHVLLTQEEHEALLKAANRSETGTLHDNPFRAALSRIDDTGRY